MNFAHLDPALPQLLDHYVDPADRARLDPVLTDLGAIAAGRLDVLAATADAHPPVLRQYTPDGTRIDEIDYHPAYAEMSQLAFERFGFAAMSHRPGVHGRPTRVPHAVKYALSYVFVQAEFGLFCPVSMTDSAARVLRMFGDPEVFGEHIDRLSSTDPDRRWTGAMFMTERQSGSDLALTETVATDHGTHWTLSGRKWFASNASADVILTLARVPGGGEGTRGLGMFLVPRLRPDGSRNGYRIDRLKEKLGGRSMASAEVTLDGAYALPVGELSRGFRQMAEMVNVSRLSNAMRATALMRRATYESVQHTRGRTAFGRPLFDQPLMRRTLLPMFLHTEAGLGLVLESAAQLDRADAGDEQARRLIRILTPLAKYTLCKQAREITAEAMEVRGGNGYIEDWVNPRLLRDAHLGSIWEGSSNVIALDVLRCLRKEGAHLTLADHVEGLLQAVGDAETAPTAERLSASWARLRRRADALLAGDDAEAQAQIGEFARTLGRTVMASLLVVQAEREIKSGAGYRKLLLANSYLTEVLEPPQPTAPVALRWLDEIADGGAVPAEAARAALR